MKLKSLALAVTMLATVAVSPASAFSVIGWKWRDSEKPLPYWINTKDAPEGFAQAVQKSSDTWTKDNRFDFQFRYSGRTSRAAVNRFDGQHVVYWNKSGAGMDETTLAATYHWSTGTRVFHFDMAFNGRHNWVIHPSSNAYDIETVCVHEFGHALGLDHSEFWSAVMYFAAPRGRMKRRLTSDDVAAAASLYPPKEPEPQPEPAKLDSPLGSIENQRPTFRWSAANNADSYNLTVNKIVDGSPVVVMRLTDIKTTSVSATASLQAGFDYTWQVVSVTDSGLSANSTVGQFQVKVVRPTNPVVVSPGRFSNSRRPVFSWRPVAGATEYYIYISEIGGRNGIAHFRLRSNRFQPNFDMNHSRGYYWWVRAANTTGSSQWVGNVLMTR